LVSVDDGKAFVLSKRLSCYLHRVFGECIQARVHNIIGGRVSYFSIACIKVYCEVMMQYLEEFQ